MKILIPEASAISIGQDRYLLFSAGKREYEYVCDILRKFGKTKTTRAKFYLFVSNTTDISCLKKIFAVSFRNLKLTKGKAKGVKINIICPFKQAKREVKEILLEYNGLYHFDGCNYISFYVPDKQRKDMYMPFSYIVTVLSDPITSSFDYRIESNYTNVSSITKLVNKV